MESIIYLLTQEGGILGPFAKLFGYLMNFIYLLLDKFGIANIGVCIILFTILTKLILFPLTFNQQKSSKLMSVMQPEIKAIQEKYKGKTDQASMMAQNEEIKAVYAKYGTSMTGGCVQMLIQMPILFALYRIIMNIPAYVPAVKEVYENVVNAIGGMNAVDQLNQFIQTNELAKIMTQARVKEFTTTDKIIDFLYYLNPAHWDLLSASFPQAADVIAAATDKVTSINTFLGMNLSTSPMAAGGDQWWIPSIYWTIPILAGLSQWFSAKLMTSTTAQNPSANGEDQTSQMMKNMNVMMPLISVFFSFSLPAGLGVYWIAQSAVMVVQQLFINSYFKKIGTDELLKKQMEKTNAKRAKKGLPPIDEKATEKKIKNMQAKMDAANQKRMEVIAKQDAKTKESTEYYNRNAKPGSLASKANMVAMYNEKNAKKGKEK